MPPGSSPCGQDNPGAVRAAPARSTTGDPRAAGSPLASGAHPARKPQPGISIPLFFCRLRFADEADYHIGRRHVTDDRGEPLVLDWRAPISQSFYRASASDPQGVAVRRRILTSEIERPRVGPMRDIVATIQPDQNELVRADIEETICVQGAPGTGNPNPGFRHPAVLPVKRL